MGGLVHFAHPAGAYQADDSIRVRKQSPRLKCHRHERGILSNLWVGTPRFLSSRISYCMFDRLNASIVMPQNLRSQPE